MKSEIVKLILNKSSLTSWYFMLHYRLHTVIGAGLLAYFAYFYTFNVDFVCHCEPDMKIVFETHCWNQMDEVQWQKLIPFVGGQLMVLLVPFLIWKIKDGNRLSVVASSDSMDEIVDFFVSTRRKNKMYVLSYTFFELFNMLLVALLCWLIYWIFGVTFLDAYNYLYYNMVEENGTVWHQVFPLHAKCKWSHHSMIPGKTDVYSSGCDIKLNGVRRNIILFDLWFLTILGGCGVLNCFLKLLLVIVKPLRQWRLWSISGCLSPVMAQNALARNLDYCDFVVLVGIGDQVTAQLFDNLCMELHSQLYQIFDDDESTENMEMVSINSQAIEPTDDN